MITLPLNRRTRSLAMPLAVACCSALCATTSSAQSNAMFIDNGGNVGIGTSAPNQKLHVQGAGDASLLVDNSGATVSPRNLIHLINNGNTRFRLTSGAETWTFDVTQRGDQRSTFTITRARSGRNEFIVDQDGNGTFAGNVTANGVLLTSSRETKENFSQVNEADLLQKLSALEISKWSYKDDKSSRQHIGPVAEDFQETFGIGDGRNISAGDLSGIAFASIKALNQELVAERAKVAALEKNQTLLLQRLEALEKREKASANVTSQELVSMATQR